MLKRFAILLAALPVAAGAADLGDVAAALRATTTMTADFTQTAPDGPIARGRMVIARPGKIRFDYDSKKLLVVSDGSRLSMIDYDVAQVSQWPVKSTPLGVLLDPDKDLSRVAKVVGETPGALRIEARDAKHPEYGTITMTFLKRPGGLALTGWTALDAQNMRTEVVLSNVRSNVAVGGENFKFRDPRVRTPGRPG
jgi:outer membrane lipoprotein-sorting protein